jgi:hypothetical protein
MTPGLSRPRRAQGTQRARAFYEVALNEADRTDLADARRVEGLGDEIALLRVQLRRALEQDPLDDDLLHAGVRLLLQALLAERRLSPSQADDLNNSVANILELFGGYMREAAGA